MPPAANRFSSIRNLLCFSVVGVVAWSGIATHHPHQILDWLQAGIGSAAALWETGPVASANQKATVAEDHHAWPWTGPYHHQLAMPLDLPPMGPFTIAEMRTFEHNSEPRDPQEMVVGIVCDGRAVAMPLTAMAGPTSHIAILEFPQTQLAVTHCNLSGCTRVLQRTQSNAANPEEGASPERTSSPLSQLKVGGLEREGGLVLLLDGVRYSHQSPAVPLADHDFAVTRFELWQAAHPTTILLLPRP